MGFIVFSPLGNKHPRIARTTNKLLDQLWQELVMIRYIKGEEKVNENEAISPWIDQAKTYFLDASRSDWRSAGLLYYYSFLNLAKALLVVKESFTYESLNTIAIYHGLQADLQDVTNLTDFKFKIFPAQVRERNNIFPYLYKVMTNQDWPFTDTITVEIRDIAAYCEDIGVEMFSLFNIMPEVISLQSLLRDDNNQVWFEMAVQTSQADIIKSHFPNWNMESVALNQMTQDDKDDWLWSLHRTPTFFTNKTLLRSPKHILENYEKTTRNMAKEVTDYLGDYALPNFREKAQTATWDFCPNITLSSKEIKWHPMLSDYLMAFVLSAILRYQPQLLQLGTPNCFVAEAWCSQSALTTLRYFLAMFTNPSLHIEAY